MTYTITQEQIDETIERRFEWYKTELARDTRYDVQEADFFIMAGALSTMAEFDLIELDKFTELCEKAREILAIAQVANNTDEDEPE